MPPGLIASAVAAHIPRMAYEDKAPDFQRGLIAGLKAMGAALRALKPDLFVVKSAHWVCSFNWYATVHDPHEGVCVADEAPDLIPGIPYRRKGDPDYARAFVAALKEAGLPAFENSTPHYAWDYAALVPLLYMDPDATVPVVQIPTVLSADHAEAMRVGGLVHQAAKRTGKRVAFLASCALSHRIVRGPALWPTPERQALDRRFIALLESVSLDDLIAWYPEYSRGADAEMGGRVLAALLGALTAMRGDGLALSGKFYGEYAQSSGSGNANIAVQATN